MLVVGLRELAEVVVQQKNESLSHALEVRVVARGRIGHRQVVEERSCLERLAGQVRIVETADPEAIRAWISGAGLLDSHDRVSHWLKRSVRGR